METLSLRYQQERPGLESGGLSVLVIRALCYCAIAAISAISGETPSDFVFTTDQIVRLTRVVTRRDDGDLAHVTNRRVGRVLGRLRLWPKGYLEKVPRPGGKGSRRWRVTLGNLERWTAAYGMSLPVPFTTNGPGTPPGPHLKGSPTPS